MTIEAAENLFLQRALVERKSISLADTREEAEWSPIKPLAQIRSWLCVPLVASDAVLGVLSIGKRNPGWFTAEHFRLAKSSRRARRGRYPQRAAL